MSESFQRLPEFCFPAGEAILGFEPTEWSAGIPCVPGLPDTRPIEAPEGGKVFRRFLPVTSGWLSFHVRVKNDHPEIELITLQFHR